MTRPSFSDLIPGAVVEGTLLPEAVEVLAVVPMGRSVKLIGKGLRTGQVREPVLSAEPVVRVEHYHVPAKDIAEAAGA